MIISDALPDPDVFLPLQQHPYFCKTMQALGQRSQFLTIRNGARKLGHVTHFSRGLARLLSFRVVAGGPIWLDWPSFTERRNVYESLADLGVRLVFGGQDEQTALGAAGFVQISKHWDVAQRSLSRFDVDNPTARLSENWQIQLRRARHNTVKVKSEAFYGEPDHWFLRERDATANKCGCSALPTEFVVAWARTNPNAARIFTAYEGRNRVGAMLFLLHWPVSTFCLSWYSPLGQDFSARNALLHEGIQWLAAHGIERLDLGKIDKEKNPEHARFFLGAGAEVVYHGGAWARLFPAALN